ncbi:MAG: hypothetical protein PHP50_00395 [Lachnospiraceae bacterium]|nr:hypothetical protein [Lachnospiraceae bacterium]
MFKIIMELASIDMDQMIDTMMTMIRQYAPNGMIGGMKIPPFFNADYMKNLPQQMKIEMLTKAMTMEKGRTIPMLEQLLQRVFGQVKIQDYTMEAIQGTEGILRMSVSVERMDTMQALDYLSDRYLHEENAGTLLGDHYETPFSKENCLNYMKNATEEDRLFYCLKLMSSQKTMVMQDLEQSAASKGITMQIANLKFLLKK